MPTRKITDLNRLEEPAGDDDLLIRDTSEGEDKRVSVEDLVGPQLPDPEGVPDGRLLTAQDDAATFAATDRLLIQWATAEAYEPVSITWDGGVLQSAEVVWPDGSDGTLTVTAETDGAVDGYEVGHDDSGRKVIQAAVTRDAAGAVTSKPALTVEDV